MKRNLLLKCLIFAVVVVAAIMVRGDLQPTYTYHALSRSEWEAQQRVMTLSESQHKVVETIRKKTCGHEVIAMLVCHVLSLLGVTVCVTFVPQRKLVRIFLKTVMLTFFLTLLFASVGFAYLVFTDTWGAVAHSSMSGNIQHDITVDPKPGETYEEYKRRVYEYSNRRYRDEWVQPKVDEDEGKFTTGFTDATNKAVK